MNKIEINKLAQVVFEQNKAFGLVDKLRNG